MHDGQAEDRPRKIVSDWVSPVPSLSPRKAVRWGTQVGSSLSGGGTLGVELLERVDLHISALQGGYAFAGGAGG